MHNKSFMAAASALLVLGSAHAQSNPEMEAMRAEIKRLSSEVESLNKRQATPSAAPAADVGQRLEAVEKQQRSAVTAGDLPGSFKLPGSDTSVKPYGFVRGDVMHDLKGTAPSDNFNNLPAQPLDNSGAPTGKTKFTAELTRLGIRTSTPTPNGAIVTRFEGDFYSYCSGSLNGNACNRDRLRIRHAYGEYNGLLVGQTFSTFMDADTLPETVDIIGPIGAPARRRAQLRYTYALDKSARIAIAAEEPRPSSAGVAAKEPDFVLRADKSFSDTLSTNLRLISHETRSAAGYRKRGYGAGLGVNFAPTNADTVLLQLSYVEGNGDIMWGSNGDADNGKQILLDRSANLNIGWTHVLNAQWRVNTVFGATNSRSDAAFGAAYGASGQSGANKTLRQAHLNAIFTPVKNVDLGAEYTHGERRTYAGETGTMSRLGFMGKYSF